MAKGWSFDDSGDPDPLPGSVTQEDQVYEQERFQAVWDALASLNDKEYFTMVWRYGLDGELPLSLEAIGEELGVSKERARHYQVMAEEKVRNAIIRSGVVKAQKHLSRGLAAMLHERSARLKKERRALTRQIERGADASAS